MRFPWLQVDVDFIGSRSKDLAAMLRVSRREATGLAIDLWTWVLGRASSAAPPDGVVRGPLETVELLIAGGVDWGGDPKHLVMGLETSGLLEYVDGGVRIRGMSRYTATWEKNRRRHGTGAEPERNRSGSGEEPVRKTQTQTQTQKEEKDLCPSVATAPKAPGKAKKPKPEKPADPRHAPLTHELCEVLGWPHHGGRTARAVSDLLRHADHVTQDNGDSPAEVLRRAAIARVSEDFPRVRELHELVTHWGHFAEPRSGQGPPRRDANDGIMRVDGQECVACGHVGEGASLGEPEIWLGYVCGCMGEWSTAGQHYTKAAEWAAQRRRGNGA